jgi:hypothetical protein
VSLSKPDLKLTFIQRSNTASAQSDDSFCYWHGHHHIAQGAPAPRSHLFFAFAAANGNVKVSSCKQLQRWEPPCKQQQSRELPLELKAIALWH